MAGRLRKPRKLPAENGSDLDPMSDDLKETDSQAKGRVGGELGGE